MPTTNVYGWHYASPTDPPDGAAQQQQLAEDIEGTVSGVDNRLNAVPKILTGSVTINSGWTSVPSSPYGQYNRGTAVVTFPAGSFNQTPSIQVTANSTVPGTLIEATYSTADANGFTINIARLDTFETIVAWAAIEI